MENLTILICDDEPGYREEISSYFEAKGFRVKTADRPSKALQLIKTSKIDVAVFDIRLPEMSGLELLRAAKKIDPELAVIMISGHGDMDCVVSAMRDGAFDFFSKPFHLLDIQIAIERLKKYLHLQNEIITTRDTYERILADKRETDEHKMIGDSQTMKNVLMLMNKVAESKNTDVLVTGESGTGKELVARGIFHLSKDNNKVFFDVNCTAIPDTLFESEFFGHTRNAFTGSKAAKKGWFEIADKGVLFLDEIGDMPLNMQAKLLRVLEERKVRRVGASESLKVDLRIIASTNMDLQKMCENNLFRKDLYYRLNKFSIHIPPLRERAQDIIPLLEYYNQMFSKAMNKQVKPISTTSLETLVSYSFPGNIRELKNIVEKAVIMSRKSDAYLNIDGPFASINKNNSIMDLNSLSLHKLEELEKSMIIQALKQEGDNKSRASKALGITRTSLLRRLKKFNINPES